MVELTARTTPGPALQALGLLTGVVAIAIGVGLITRVDTGFGVVWAGGFVLLGLIVIWSWLAPRLAGGDLRAAHGTTLDGEPARVHPRRAGSTTTSLLVVTGTLGAWCLAIAVVGTWEQSWLWLLLGGLPAAYFCGFPVLWALGRLRPGAAWVTPTRVVDEHLGLRSEIAIADVAGLSPRTETLHLTPREGASVTRRRLTPRPWRAREHASDLVVQTGDLAAGSQGLAAEVQRLLGADGQRTSRRRVD